MEYGFTQKLFGYFYHNSCMKQAKAQHLSLDSKAIKNEYKAVLERADDIGKSHLMSSYCMGAYFIALNRKTSLSPEECFSLYKDGLYNNKLFHMVIGNADSYLDEKKLPGRKKWSEESHLRRYKNDWVLDIIGAGQTMTSYSAMIITTAGSVISAVTRDALNWQNICAVWISCLLT